MSTVLGLEDYRLREVRYIIFLHINFLKENFHFEDLDFLIQDISLFGSRISGIPKKDSDLDVKIKYTGNARENDLFNALNKKEVELKIENIKVDFYPEKI